MATGASLAAGPQSREDAAETQIHAAAAAAADVLVLASSDFGRVYALATQVPLSLLAVSRTPTGKIRWRPVGLLMICHWSQVMRTGLDNDCSHGADVSNHDRKAALRMRHAEKADCTQRCATGPAAVPTAVEESRDLGSSEASLSD